MGRLTKVEWNEICQTILREGYEIISVLAKEYSVTPQSINSQLRKRGIRQRNNRNDKGKRCVDKDIFNELGVLVVHKKVSAGEAIKNMIYESKLDGKIENGQLVDSVIHPGTLNRWLRDEDLNKKSRLKRASYRMVAEKPLHVLQWDSTRATQWYVEKEDENDKVINFVSTLSENKNRTNKRAKLVFMVFKDMFSKKVWIKVDSHESTATWLEFFWEVINEVGIPENVYSDNASFFSKGGRIRDVLTQLGCKFNSHLPGNSQAKGMVERAIRTLEEKAKVTLIEKAKTLKEYDKIIKLIAREMNSHPDRQSGLTPDQVFYSRLSMEEVRKLASKEDFIRLAPIWDERVLKTNLTVEWKGNVYQAQDNKSTLANYVGKKVRVEEHVKRNDRINLFVEGKEIEALDISIYEETTTTYGEYKSMPLSKKEKHLKEFDQFKKDNKLTASYDRRFNQEFEDIKSQYAAPNTVWLNDILNKRKGKEHSREDAQIYLASNDIQVTFKIKRLLDNLFGDREKVYESEIDPLIRQQRAKQA